MTNGEKYRDEILKEYGSGILFCTEFVRPKVLKRGCDGIACCQCEAIMALWLNEEYKEPSVDWSKVAVDTPILVRDYREQQWNNRHFAKYEDGKVYAWDDGCTSWSIDSEDYVTLWKYAKLAEVE